MKKFEFSLSKLQNYKEQILAAEKNTLGILRKELVDLENEFEEIGRVIELKNEELAYAMVRSVTPADFAMQKLYITAKQQERHSVKFAILEKEEEVAKQLEVVIEATKEVSTLDKLEEHQLEEYNYLQLKEDELFIEEFVNSQRHRLKAAM